MGASFSADWNYENHTSLVAQNVLGHLNFITRKFKDIQQSVSNGSTSKLKNHQNGGPRPETTCRRDTILRINSIAPSEDINPTSSLSLFARIALPDSSQKQETLTKIQALITSKWKLEAPKIILSFVGGQKDIRLDANTAMAFRDGIINLVMRKSNIWLFSGGTHTGETFTERCNK